MQALRSFAFACLDFDADAPDALLDAWFALDPRERKRESALAARHFSNAMMFANKCDAAVIGALYGNLRCLRWGLPRTTNIQTVTIICATTGHLACLVCAHEHGCPWDEETCGTAAMKGNLACLQYAHEHGCAWDSDTCSIAAQYGHLACLQYAHENGCPWDSDTCGYAAQNGHTACLQYAQEHGCPSHRRYYV